MEYNSKAMYNGGRLFHAAQFHDAHHLVLLPPVRTRATRPTDECLRSRPRRQLLNLLRGEKSVVVVEILPTLWSSKSSGSI